MTLPGFTTSTTTGVFPTGTVATGTVSAGGTLAALTGVGTLFSTELAVGQYIWVPTQRVLVKIARIINDTSLETTTVAPAFAASAFQYCGVRGLPTGISIANTGGATGYIVTIPNGSKTFPAGISTSYESNAGVEAVAWDATGTTFVISTTLGA